MKTIAHRHAEWAEAIIPKSAPDVQRREMRIAFYSGFQSALAAGLEMAEQSGASDDVGVAMIEQMHRECAEFARDVLAGRA